MLWQWNFAVAEAAKRQSGADRPGFTEGRPQSIPQAPLAGDLGGPSSAGYARKKAWLAGEGEDEPSEGERNDDAIEEVTERAEDAFLARGAGEPSEGDGDDRGAEKHGGEMAEMHELVTPLTQRATA